MVLVEPLDHRWIKVLGGKELHLLENREERALKLPYPKPEVIMNVIPRENLMEPISEKSCYLSSLTFIEYPISYIKARTSENLHLHVGKDGYSKLEYLHSKRITKPGYRTERTHDATRGGINCSFRFNALEDHKGRYSREQWRCYCL